MVTDYIQGCLKYSIPLLKDRIYVYDESVLTYINIDKPIDNAMILSTPTLLTGFNISYAEATSLDERYKFDKTLNISMNYKVDIASVFQNKFYVIVEDYDGNLYLTNPDFQYKYTYTYSLAEGTNQTAITLQTQSNFPLLKIDVTPPLYSECKTYKFAHIKALELIEKEWASYSTNDNILYTTEPLKQVDFLKNTLSFQEQYDGEKVTSTLSFNMPLKSANVSWDWNLLEFKDNVYTAVISTDDDYKILTGIYTGLQPNYSINASMTDNGNYAITMIETSNDGSLAVQMTNEELLGYTWEYIRILDEHKAYMCNMSHGCGMAQIVIMAEVDNFGNKTGNYKVEESIYDGVFVQDDPTRDYSWYEENFGWLRKYNVMGTFEDDYPNNWFPTNECACYDPSTKCLLSTDMPPTIEFDSTGTTSYTIQASCDWSIDNVPSGITISPLTGAANTEYTITITNNSSTIREDSFSIGCCTSKYYYKVAITDDSSCIIGDTYKYIDCNGQTVVFNIKDGCELVVNNIPTGLLYTISNGVLAINVGQNSGQSSRNYYIMVTCCGESLTLTISQNPPVTAWLEDGYICDDGTKYVKEVLWSGSTYSNMVKTERYRLGTMIEENSPDCRSIEKFDFIGYTCIDGAKYELLRRFISYDDGETWLPQSELKLGELVEEESSFCEQETQYKWELTDEWVCADL